MEIFRQITANNISLKEYPFSKELSMEAYLIENEDILILDKENFNNVNVLDAEIALKAGRKFRDGRIDILANYAGEYLGIVELKTGEINQEALSQLEDYLEQREQILEIDKNDDPYWVGENKPKWVGVLVGSSISRDLQDKFSSGYKYNDIPIAGLVIRRFRSDKNEIFVITDTFFTYKYSSKDYSKFEFNGKIYNKGRLVNEVVKSYVELHPNKTFAELKKIFSDKIQGSFGVFDTKQRADDIYERTGHKRYYINSEELISIVDAQIATCSQWNPNNIDFFIKNAQNVGFNIIVK